MDHTRVVILKLADSLSFTMENVLSYVILIFLVERVLNFLILSK